MIEAASLEMWGVKPKLSFTFMVSIRILAIPWFEVLYVNMCFFNIYIYRTIYVYEDPYIYIVILVRFRFRQIDTYIYIWIKI